MQLKIKSKGKLMIDNSSFISKVFKNLKCQLLFDEQIIITIIIIIDFCLKMFKILLQDV